MLVQTAMRNFQYVMDLYPEELTSGEGGRRLARRRVGRMVPLLDKEVSEAWAKMFMNGDE